MANLLPQTQQQWTRQERRRRVVIVLLLFLLAVEALANIALVPSILLARSKRASAVSQLGTIETLVSRQERDNVNADVRAARAELAALTTVTGHTPVTVDIASVTRQIDEGIRVESIVHQSTPVVVRGEDELSPTASQTRITIRGTGSTREALLAFVKALERDPRFVQVDLPVSNLAAREDIPFSLTIMLADAE